MTTARQEPCAEGTRTNENYGKIFIKVGKNYEYFESNLLKFEIKFIQITNIKFINIFNATNFEFKIFLNVDYKTCQNFKYKIYQLFE